TFFRVGLPRSQANRTSAWAARDLVFMHFALTDENAHRFRHSETARRVALGLAGADSAVEHVWLDASSLSLSAAGTPQPRGRAPDCALELALASTKPPTIHGAAGVSHKSAVRGNASHYYSLTRLDTRGTLVVDRDTIAVTGRSWMDHEFGSSA